MISEKEMQIIKEWFERLTYEMLQKFAEIEKELEEIKQKI